jgi:NADPH:quinone reductase-like Zn-dependent oxidoreductase
MKAMVYTEYGAPEVLHLQEVEKPTPKDNEVLIKIHATTVTAGDVNMRGFVFVPPGFGFLPRLMFGLRRPRKPILGVEFAGEIAAVGQAVQSFKVGDPVFGIHSAGVGAYAEYKTMPADKALVIKPANLTYEEAAALPFGAGTALFFLRDKAAVQKGQKVLVRGAAGGVGAYAVQLAKYYGAEVTGVCSTGKVELVKSLGADKVIDYTKEDFTKTSERYDVIVDTVVGKVSFAESAPLLKENGFFIPVAGGMREIRQAFTTSLRGGKKVVAGSPAERQEDMLFIKELAEAGQLKPVIDRAYPLEQMVEAHRYVDGGHKKGSVVITVTA